MRRVIYLLLALIIVSDIHLQPAQAQSDEGPWLLAQLNTLRQSKGAGLLIINPQLTISATNHSTYLSTHQWGNPHVEDNGSTPSSRAWAAGYLGKLVSENVVGGPTATKEWAFQWWVNEPIHFQNMTLPQWTEVGIGVVTGPEGRFYTMDFGTTTWGTIVTAAPPAAPSALPPTAAQAAQVAATAQNPAKISAPPTKRPTPIPTSTSTITLTPSVTFTPHATFTPTFTATSPPPTMTAIVMLVSPPSPPTTGLTLIAAVFPTAPPHTNSGNKQPHDLIRSLIPIAIALPVAGLLRLAV